MEITNTIKYVGVNDHRIDLFEGQYKVPNGMSYNSYVIIDEKIAVMDTVDQHFTHEWLDNIQSVLNGRQPDYLIVQHMEPDHSANIANFMKIYDKAIIVSSDKAFAMMLNFFGTAYEERRIVIKEGDKLELGRHTLNFIAAPMVHWPEVMMTYDSYERALFSADGFGKFGALDVQEDWVDEARRYYIGIVGKYGRQVQAVLKKAGGLDISMILPLHGPFLYKNLPYYLNLYNTWSSYDVEKDGVVVCYTSVYGHTKAAVDRLVEELKASNVPEVKVYDLARCDMSQAVADAFAYSKLVLATTTYNADIYPFMKQFIDHLTERSFQNRKIGLIENGSWAPLAAKIMKDMLAKSPNLTFIEPVVHIRSAMSDTNKEEISALCQALSVDYLARDEKKANKNDMKALFSIGYGLYVVTSNDGKKDNGLIVNTVVQLTDNPFRVMVSINKDNYSHHVIKQTGIMNVNCLNIETPFKVFQQFGFQSGRNIDKFKNEKEVLRSDNGLVFLSRYINAFFSLKVEDYKDLGTHGMFICSVSEARVINNVDTMTYTYYQNNVKPKADTKGKKGFVCKVCGYVYEGDVLPDDFVCPLCKHGAADFEEIK
ncbi:MAG: flavin reductase [Erysipelotrichaceae bacterium]|nr:flavin reductase [Erysipelotrichaceae bacterium]